VLRSLVRKLRGILVRRSMIYAMSALLAASAAWAASSPTTAPGETSKSDLSGYWELAVDSRQVPAAKLSPNVTPADIASHAEGDEHAIRWCNLLGLPWQMDSGRPLSIRQGRHEVLIVSEVQELTPRHLYLDRSKHIGSADFDASTVGDSIAHWEADTLVADSVGFSGTRGITQIPGGGYRTENSHLVERFRLAEQGAVLNVTSTWTDQGVFAVPHTYQYRYYRLPETYEPPPAADCNPYDEERTRFLARKPASDKVSHAQ
jgi:hypothetical protein